MVGILPPPSPGKRPRHLKCCFLIIIKPAERDRAAGKSYDLITSPPSNCTISTKIPANEMISPGRNPNYINAWSKRLKNGESHFSRSTGDYFEDNSIQDWGATMVLGARGSKRKSYISKVKKITRCLLTQKYTSASISTKSPSIQQLPASIFLASRMEIPIS